MIHDMKTPLSSIMMCSDALNDEKIESMPELKKSFLGVVKSETVHLLKLINRLSMIIKEILFLSILIIVLLPIIVS